MIVKKELLTKLRGLFKLNSYEAKIWIALLSQGSATAGELSSISSVPRSRTYDILQSLESRGFIMMQVGKPIKYAAISPKEVISRVKERIEDETRETLENLDKAGKSEAVQEMDLLFTNGVKRVEPSQLTGAIKGRKNIFEHLSMLIKASKKSVLIVTSDESAISELHSIGSAIKQAKERGVKITFATETSSPAPKIREITNNIITGNKSNRFVVVDGQEVVMMMTGENETHPSYDSAISISSQSIGEILESAISKI